MKNILIFRQSSLGDFIVGIPAIKTIKKKFFNYKIHYLLYRNSEIGAVNPDTILNNNQLVDEFIYINKKDRSFNGLIKLIIKLRRYQFAKFFYLNETERITKFRILRHLLFFSLCKVKKMSGFNLQYKPNYSEGNESLHIARRVDGNIKRSDIRKFISNSYKINKHSQNLTMKKFQLNGNFKNFITISNGGKLPLLAYNKGVKATKDWGLKNWKILLKKIIYHYPTLKIVIVGSKREYEKAKKLEKIKSKNIINLCGKTNIKELIEIIDKSKFHISHDDGTMHVASMFSKKSIAIFSNWDIEGRWFPENKNSNVFYPKVSIK